MEVTASSLRADLAAEVPARRGSDPRQDGREALRILAFSRKKAARMIHKVLESAIANAEHNHGADIDELKVRR